MSSKMRRRAVNYEHNTPRCLTCVAYEPLRVVVVNEVPFYRQPFCKTNAFQVQPNGLCDRWTGKNGDSLEHGDKPKGKG